MDIKSFSPTVRDTETRQLLLTLAEALLETHQANSGDCNSYIIARDRNNNATIVLCIRTESGTIKPRETFIPYWTVDNNNISYIDAIHQNNIVKI